MPIVISSPSPRPIAESAFFFHSPRGNSSIFNPSSHPRISFGAILRQAGFERARNQLEQAGQGILVLPVSFFKPPLPISARPDLPDVSPICSNTHTHPLPPDLRASPAIHIYSLGESAVTILQSPNCNPYIIAAYARCCESASPS